ncbi:hypothetical protein [Rhizobium sp. LCM 4573]|uniref:hypothetical protein n=1 Tax=Rhizobium sp. LCM 4573 TaxID=1848291 RepID=UPI001041D013|nr:hypothetical protein [Rhizobium sp. LCM 4573]
MPTDFTAFGNFAPALVFTNEEEAEMKHVDNRQVRVPGPPRDHCVESSCGKAGMSQKETQRMLKLLGKRAAIHELSINVKDRPPKFR